MDSADMADEWIENWKQGHINLTKSDFKVTTIYCEDCDCEIPPERRKLEGGTRWCDCQEDFEKRYK